MSETEKCDRERWCDGKSSALDPLGHFIKSKADPSGLGAFVSSGSCMEATDDNESSFDVGLESSGFFVAQPSTPSVGEFVNELEFDA
jgi:hypothetical protein